MTTSARPPATPAQLMDRIAATRDQTAPYCDFCGTVGPLAFVYGCTALPDPRACSPCVFLIDRYEPNRLADRAARLLLQRLNATADATLAIDTPPLARVRRVMREMHLTFWQHRSRAEDRPYRPPRHGNGRTPTLRR